KPLSQTGRVKNTREAAAYTFGYNYSVFAQRVHDVLTAVRFIKTNERPTKQLAVVGLEGTGPIVASARAVSGGAIQRAVIDTEGFRFGKVLNIHDPNFLPGGAKYGDVPGLLALALRAPTLLLGEKESIAGSTLAQSADSKLAPAEAARF